MNRHVYKYLLSGLIIIWFFLANSIMGKIYNYNRVEIEKNPIIKQEQQLPLVYSVDRFSLEENLFNLVNISGWALCPTSEAEDDQEVSVLLESDRMSYMIETERQMRSDIKEVLKQRDGFEVSDMHGFSSTFCPYVIRDGLYQVSLVCYEDGQIVGKQEVEYLLEKKNGKIEKR